VVKLGSLCTGNTVSHAIVLIKFYQLIPSCLDDAALWKSLSNYAWKPGVGCCDLGIYAKVIAKSSAKWYIWSFWYVNSSAARRFKDLKWDEYLDRNKR